MHPIFAALDEDDERLLAKLAIAEALKTGTTTIVEGGTSWYTNAAVDAAVQLGSPFCLAGAAGIFRRKFRNGG